MEKTTARQNVIDAMRRIDDHFAEIIAIAKATDGKTIPELLAAIKSRDEREPGRKEKQQAEERLARIFRKAFNKQRVLVSTWVETYYWDRKSIKVDIDLPNVEFDEDDMSDLVTELLKIAKEGILLFGTGNPIIDYTLSNAEAAKWASKYAYDLIKGINGTTRDVLRTLIRTFVDTPGYTLGDVMRGLPFDAVRAQRIAVTETTRAFAEGQMMAGRELQKKYPDVRIIKIWFTNNDDRVCPICAPLDGTEVDLKQSFPGGIDKPPAHVNCRCWIETTTALAEL